MEGGRGLSYYNPRQKCKQFRRYFYFVFDPNPLYIFSFTFIINKQIIPVDAYARLSAECSIEGSERSIIKVVWCQREIRLGIFYDYLVFRTARHVHKRLSTELSKHIWHLKHA